MLGTKQSSVEGVKLLTELTGLKEESPLNYCSPIQDKYFQTQFRR